MSNRGPVNRDYNETQLCDQLRSSLSCIMVNSLIPTISLSAARTFRTFMADNSSFFQDQQHPEEEVQFGTEIRYVTFDTPTNISNDNGTHIPTTISSLTAPNENVDTSATP